jgi:[protein-PII] uridylyltransferase
MAERAQIARRRKRAAERKLRVNADDPRVAAIFGGLPDRYFMENTPGGIAGHVEVLRRREGACALEVVPRRGKSWVELVVVADDVPGLLAKIAGVLFANKLDIMHASIYSREPFGAFTTGEALDIFRVRPAGSGSPIDEARIAGIARDLAAVLEGRIAVEDLVGSRAAAANASLFARSKPEVPPTEVRVDNEISRDFTVVDVFTEDRPGVLYTIARTLHEQGLDIHRSKVAVEADRVADIFYVRDNATSEKIVDRDRIVALRTALMAALPGSRGEARAAAG